MNDHAAPAPDDHYRADAIKALHLLLHHRWNPATAAIDDEALREKAEVWVDAAVSTMTVDMVMLTAGSELAAETLARAVVQCMGAHAVPTKQDLAEALAVIERMANPPHES
jgi:hypothetical protein